MAATTNTFTYFDFCLHLLVMIPKTVVIWKLIDNFGTAFRSTNSCWRRNPNAILHYKTITKGMIFTSKHIKFEEKLYAFDTYLVFKNIIQLYLTTCIICVETNEFPCIIWRPQHFPRIWCHHYVNMKCYSIEKLRIIN